MVPFQNPAVAAKFDAYPDAVRPRMLEIRELVFETAAATPGVGAIEETLKWGEPAYVTRNKTGSTVRLDWKERRPESYAIYFHCQTHLIESFRSRFPDDFEFEGNRALILGLDRHVPTEALTACIAASLTYHLNPSKKHSQK